MPSDCPYIKIAVGNRTNGSTLWVDAIQIEEVTDDTKKASPFKPSGMTVINGGTIVTGSITADKIAAKTITANSGIITDAAITNAMIADLAVTVAKIADATITNAKIANATIESGKIKSLDAGKITTGTLSADRIGANSITANKLSSSVIEVLAPSQGIAALWNENTYTGGSTPDGEALIVSYDPLTGVTANKGGWVMWRGTKRNLPSIYINPNQTCPYNLTIYIVARLSSASATEASAVTPYLVWYNGSWKSSNTNASTSTAVSEWTWNESTDIVIGSFVEPASEAPFVDCELYNPCLSSRQLTKGATAYKNIADWCYNNNITYINGGKIYTGTVTATQIASNAVTTEKLNANAVTTAKLATDAIKSKNYAYSSGNYSTAGTFLDLSNGVIRSKNFGIDASGNAYINGAVTATSGTIGKWTINGTSLYKGSATYGASGTGNMYLGDSGISISNAFKVSNAGALTATGANISGAVTATSGTIGGCTISNGVLQIKKANITEKLQAGQIDVTNLFAQDITATGTIRGVKLVGGSITTTNTKGFGIIDPYGPGLSGLPSISITEGTLSAYLDDSNSKKRYEINHDAVYLKFISAGSEWMEIDNYNKWIRIGSGYLTEVVLSELYDEGWIASGICKYRKKNGWVEIDVYSTSYNTTTSYTTLMTLPEKYRPANMVYASGMDASATVGMILAVNPNGAVSIKAAKAVGNAIAHIVFASA